jgi:hypothetical protein
LTEEGPRTKEDKKTENSSRRFEKWREWEPGETTGEQLRQPTGPEWFVRHLAADDSLDPEMARAPTLDSEATGSEATGSEGTGLEVTGLDAMEADIGMAGEFKAAGFKAGMETTGSTPTGPNVIGLELSDPDNTESEKHPPVRPHPLPDEEDEELEEAEYEVKRGDPDAILGSRTEAASSDAKITDNGNAARFKVQQRGLNLASHEEPEEVARTTKDEKAENRRKEFEKWREWEPGGTTGEQLGRLKGPGRSVCVGAGSKGLDEDMGDGAADPNATESEEHPPTRPNLFPDEDLAQRGPTGGQPFAGDQPFVSRHGTHAISGEHLVRCRSAGDQFFASPLGTRTASKDEKTEDRRRRFEKWREWEPGGTTGEQLGLLKGSGWSVCMGAGSEGLDVEMRDSATDPDATESEEYLPVRPDPWPGDDDTPLLSGIRGKVALWVQLDGARATLQSTELGLVEEVLWAETERDEVREEAWQRRRAYAKQVVARTSKNLVKPSLIRLGDLVMLRDPAVANEKGLKFYYRWTGPYLVRSATQGSMSFVLQHPHEDKALYRTHHRDDVRLWTMRPEHLRYPPGTPIQPEFPTNLRQYRKGLLPHLAGKFFESECGVQEKAGEGQGGLRKRRRV